MPDPVASRDPSAPAGSIHFATPYLLLLELGPMNTLCDRLAGALVLQSEVEFANIGNSRLPVDIFCGHGLAFGVDQGRRRQPKRITIFTTTASGVKDHGSFGHKTRRSGRLTDRTAPKRTGLIRVPPISLMLLPSSSQTWCTSGRRNPGKSW